MRLSVPLELTLSRSSFPFRTPWGGHQAAEAGIRRLKKPVPSWLDVAPNSEFLEWIYLSRLPGGTRHLLIYGSTKAAHSGLRARTTRVVTVESETDPRIKNNASRVIHLPYGHVEILSEQKTLAETLRFLNSRTSTAPLDLLLVRFAGICLRSDSGTALCGS